MSATLTVYDGRTFLGSVRENASGMAEAFDHAGRSLGNFPTRKAAVAAVPAAPMSAAVKPTGRRAGVNVGVIGCAS